MNQRDNVSKKRSSEVILEDITNLKTPTEARSPEYLPIWIMGEVWFHGMAEQIIELRWTFNSNYIKSPIESENLDAGTKGLPLNSNRFGRYRLLFHLLKVMAGLGKGRFRIISRQNP